MRRISPWCVVTICSILVAPAAVENQFFDSEGVRIRYTDQGPRAADPLVLIHGFTQRIETAWEETGVIDALDDDFRVIALDCRGHGKSDTPHEPVAYGSEMAADVVRLLDHLEIDRAHVAGYSMGGRITFKLIADHPERLRSALPCGHNGGGPNLEVFQSTMVSLQATGSIRPLLDYLVTPGSMTEEEIQGIVDTQRESNDTDALLAVLRGWTGLDPEPAKLAANRVPCLAIIGENDPLRAGLEVTAASMGNLKVEVLPGHDHMTSFRTAEFVAAIKLFVATHATGADQSLDSDG